MSAIKRPWARFVSMLLTATALSLSAPISADAAVVRASANAPAQVRLAERVAGILQNLLQTNRLRFDGEVRLTQRSNFHAEAFFGQPGYVLLGESYAEALSDSELTFVLAHELVHLLHDHSTRLHQFYQSQVSAGLARKEDIHHTLEAEADEIGLKWAVAAGARPEDAVSALQRAYGEPTGFLKIGQSRQHETHPGLSARAAALLARR